VRIRFVPPFLLLWVLLGSGRSLASDLALTNAKIYPAPTEPPIENAASLIHDGRIVAVGPSVSIKIPRDAQVIDCKDLVITPGFWNSHVHLILPGLLHAEKLSSERLTSQLEGMLTRWGFTTVFDIASVLENTNLIRRRIESGEVQGPRLLQILASLTTNPARKFGYSGRRGRIAKGMDADLTVLQADPAENSTAFSRVRYTIVGGKVIWSQK
jgi:imidazolonepropionase-like amidohydrolase